MFTDIYHNVTTIPKKKSLLPRPRLDLLLSQAIEYNFATVTAGMGYGKTQAISMFLNQHNYRVAWRQLSTLDNFQPRFWEGFVYAISVQNKEVAAQFEKLGFPDSLAKFSRFLQMLAEIIYSGSRVIFVFDDYHVIHDESIIDFIEKLISANLENFCIILSTRTMTNLSLSNDLEKHIVAEDLCFTKSETAAYLRMQEISLSEEEFERIYRFTEGWPLAIYLVGLTLKRGESVVRDPLSGAMPLIFQMIENELFLQYVPPVKEILLKLSFLEKFHIDLIKDLSGSSLDAILATINTNMFIHRNPYTHDYHFHNLFSAFLKTKQVCLPEEQILETYEKAADWYAKNDAKIEAMSYYKKCGRFDRIWEIILHEPPNRYPKETATLYSNFLEDFPEEFVKKNPMIRVIHASLLFNNLALDRAARDLLDLLEELNARPDSTENTAVIGEAYIVLALIRQAQKNREFVRYYKLADECLPGGSRRDYRNLKIIDSNAAINPNSLEKEEVERLQRDFFEAMPYAAKVMHGFGYGIEYLAAAEVSYFTGDLPKAQEYVFEAIYRARKKRQHDIVCGAYFLLMRISSAKGNYNDTMNYMKQLRKYVENPKISDFLSILDIAEGWFTIRMGRGEKVARWLLDDSLNTQVHAPISIGRDRMIRAFYFLEEEKYYELLPFLDQLYNLYRQKGLWLELVSTLVLKSISYHYIGNQSACVSALQSAYDITQESHFIMQFVEMGRHMRTLIDNIRKADGHHIPASWLDEIYSKSSTYAKWHSYYKAKYNSAYTTSQHVNLTKREKEIFHYLCQGLTREEIAVSLDISASTVKSILQNIYNKLGAVNSADAVRIAMQMGIEK